MGARGLSADATRTHTGHLQRITSRQSETASCAVRGERVECGGGLAVLAPDSRQVTAPPSTLLAPAFRAPSRQGVLTRSAAARAPGWPSEARDREALSRPRPRAQARPRLRRLTRRPRPPRLIASPPHHHLNHSRCLITNLHRVLQRCRKHYSYELSSSSSLLLDVGLSQGLPPNPFGSSVHLASIHC